MSAALSTTVGAMGGGASSNFTAVSPYLTGDYGSDEAPEPVSIVANDPDNSGLGFGTGDTLTLSFSRPTNRDTSTDQKLYVDSLLTFSPPVGDDYSGEWVDD